VIGSFGGEPRFPVALRVFRRHVISVNSLRLLTHPQGVRDRPSAWWGFPLLLGCFVLGCQSAEECKDFAASNDGHTSWGQCGDKRTREIRCDGLVRGALTEPGKPVSCTCSIEGVVGKAFQTADPGKLMIRDDAARIANEQCGWHLE
jgi:hypothetical protein